MPTNPKKNTPLMLDAECVEKLQKLADDLAEGNKSRLVRQWIREKWASWNERKTLKEPR